MSWFSRFAADAATPYRLLLAVWGRHDPAFLPAGAAAYRRDLPDAQVHLLDAGHFALETHAQEVATLIRAFLEPIDQQ
jgi:pimeloyl-ACP methyl ester carboxylesterase